MDSTTRTVKRLWHEIEAKTKFSPGPISIAPWNPIEAIMEFGGMPDADLSSAPAFKELRFSPGILTVYSVTALRGCLAHEMGHFALGVPNNHDLVAQHKAEDEADKWAAERGFAPEMLLALKEIEAYERRYAGKLYTDPNDTHTEDGQRALNIKRWGKLSS